MPYYGEGLPYYYGGPFATHSSLMTGTPRSFHAPLSRFSPHLSTISESPLSTLRRYSPVTVAARPRRVVDTADIDVSTPRILTGEGSRQRNRLRRDRPTIKIRSQALKDNPALRQHNERHEKSVGELLVEKFLIKDKKQEEAEQHVQLFHQVSLGKEEDQDLQQVKTKITRRFTRRRSSADIQLDPEQLEREVAYAQVQAKVLDTLVAEEQAEIENEVRRGTLIKKGTTGSLKNGPGFFRPQDGDSVSQGEEDPAAQKVRKTLKKVKKKKKPVEKPPPPADDENPRERRSSTSSDVSVESQREAEVEENEEDGKNSQPQMFKVEASNSVGDFSTIWVNGADAERKPSVEQFRESVRIPVPRKLGVLKVAREDEPETEVVLPVKRPYVKDTTRNSVHFTVRTPPETAKTEPLKKLEAMTNGVKKETKQAAQKEEPRKLPDSLKPSKVAPASKVVSEAAKPEAASTLKIEEAERRPEPPRPRKEASAGRIEEGGATLAVDPLPSENSASVALASAAEGLPKASKITADGNNAVEAPKLSLRDAVYLAKPRKNEGDEDVASPLPGNKVSKAVTLASASSWGVPSGPSGVEPIGGTPSADNPSVERDASDATSTTLVAKTTFFKGPGSEKREDSLEDAEKAPAEDAKRDEVKGASFEKLPRKSDEGARSPLASVAPKKAEIKVEEKLTVSKIDKEPKVPWRTKVTKANPPESGVTIDRAIGVDSKAKTSQGSTKQCASVGAIPEEGLSSKMQSVKLMEGLNGESGSLSKSTSTESIDFWSEIQGPESPRVAKVVSKGFGFAGSKSAETRNGVDEPKLKELEEKKETDAKISLSAAAAGVEDVTVAEESVEAAPKKALKKKKNLSITIGAAPTDAYSTIKKAPPRRQDSSASTISGKSVASTPDNSAPVSEVSTPTLEVPVINIIETPTPTRSDSQILEDDEEPKTPTNEWAESSLPKISKWSKHSDLTNMDGAEKDVTPVPSKDASAAGSLESSPESSKKKKVVRKKKSSTTKKASGSKDSSKDSKESKKGSPKAQESLKPPESKSKASPKTAPAPKPIDLIRMFYTTPSALLTATPRDLSKVRRAKIKRRKHHSRTPSVSSDSTGSTNSTNSTATTESSGSTCTELDDDPDKRMNSTRSNDSGFDGSPRISTPSQSSDTQRNSDSSDHFPSGRITPPATNLPRFKKYAVTDFNFLKVLGKGSFGKVLLAELRGTECVYAVKCLKKDVVLEDDDVECTLIERKVLTLATRHPYLCHLFCTFQTDSHLFFVMEYLNGGDLMFHIQKSGRFVEPRARFYAAEIWSGLNFLHKKGIVYRDLKLDNVLLDFEGHIRIADFGMCKLQIFLDRTADTFCGTPDYMAPEIIKGLKYNQAVDWWSYGVLLYEMLTGQSPFSGCDEDELFWSICNERPFIPRYLSQEATDVLVCLLEKDAGKRLPGHEIALHAFFQQLPWDRLERRQLESPFKPALDHTLDTRYFDTAFTAERPRLSPVPDQILTSIDQGVFRGFSYTNPNATD
ncbi:uncharacterized protein LOC143376910 isoform X2 [Andrena cerasifolii]|uniref:uncharacterized protein LOC143376910 isoform X2 n=1 Tax=Andrena cerasifolii TaxID=2819439 RepID=UPI004037EC76